MSRWQREAALDLRIGAGDWQITQAGDVLARAAFDQLDELLRSLATASLEGMSRGARLDVVVHERWVRSFTVEPPAGLRSLGELRALAAARLEQLFGVDASEWVVRGQWCSTRSFAVTALPVALVEAVRSLCVRAKLRLIAIVPRWVRALSAQPPSTQARWWGITQEGVLTVALVREQRLTFARSMRTAAGANEDEIMAVAVRERTRSALESDDATDPVRRLDVSASTTSDTARPALYAAHDAARNSPRFGLPPLRRAGPMLAAALGLALVLAIGAKDLSALRDEQARLQIELAAARAAAKAVAPEQPRTKPLPVREVEAFNAVAHRLNTPWPDIFAALEQTMPGNVALLGVEPDTGHARLRGSARAADHRAMVDYVERVSSRSPFGQARLVRHELDEKDPARPLKFQFEVSLRSAQASEAAR